MRAVNQSFGELRALMQRPLTDESWEDLCEVLERWPDAPHLEQVALPYALAHLPPHVHTRCLTPAWREKLLDGQLPQGLLRVVMSAHFAPGHARPHALERLVARDDFEHLEALSLHGWKVDSSSLEALAHAPALARLTHLTLSPHLGMRAHSSLEAQLGHGNQVSALFSQESALAGLAHLDMSGVKLDAAAMLTLCNASALAGLRHLRLEDAWLAQDTIGLLAETAWPLSRLDISRNARLTHPGVLEQAALAATLDEVVARHMALAPEVLCSLANSELFPQLTAVDLTQAEHLNAVLGQVDKLAWTELSVGQGALSEQTFLGLLERAALGQVERLFISWAGLTDDALVAMARSRSFDSLRALNLTQNFDITARGLEALCGSGASVCLEELYLSGIPLGDAGARALAQGRFSRALRALYLAGCDLRSEGVLDLLASPNVERVHTLRLDRNPALDDRVLHALAHHAAMISLRTLNLAGTQVTDAGVTALMRSRVGQGLRELDLSQTPVGDEALESIAAHGHNLRHVHLSHLEVGKPGLKALAGAPALARLHHLRLDGPPLQDPAAREVLASSPYLGSWIKRDIERAWNTLRSPHA